MKGMLAQLSPHEETALRKVGFGSGEALEPDHIRRLLQLDLIAWNGWRWSLTKTGHRRYDALMSADRGVTPLARAGVKRGALVATVRAMTGVTGVCPFRCRSRRSGGLPRLIEPRPGLVQASKQLDGPFALGDVSKDRGEADAVRCLSSDRRRSASPGEPLAGVVNGGTDE